jgi:LysR family transcriptional regulator, transcriptional activator of nhaA
MARLNYKHLRYFWTVAKAGGIARACERLHLTPQTISGQLSAFEDALGHKLFARSGRRLELTEAGRMVLRYADEMFTVGEELEEALRHEAGSLPLLFKVGIVDSVPKSVAYRLLEPAAFLAEPLRMVCREGKLAGLMADLAIHRLDLVIADGPMPADMSVRGFNHPLGECGITFLATPALAQQHRARFPRCLDGAPLLLPGEEAAVRPRLMQWIESVGVRPKIVAEFDDGALTTAFGMAGTGVFVVPSAIAEEVRHQYRVRALGHTDAVTERFYAISVERRLTHPAVVAISSSARTELFGKRRGN